MQHLVAKELSYKSGLQFSPHRVTLGRPLPVSLSVTSSVMGRRKDRIMIRWVWCSVLSAPFLWGNVALNPK